MQGRRGGNPQSLTMAEQREQSLEMSRTLKQEGRSAPLIWRHYKIETQKTWTHGYSTNSLLSDIIASTRLLLTAWLNSWESISQPANFAHLPILPFSVFPLYVHTRFVKSLFLCVCAAPTVWNTLPYEIRSSNTISSFKSSLKTYLFQQSYWCVCVCVGGGGQYTEDVFLLLMIIIMCSILCHCSFRAQGPLN